MKKREKVMSLFVFTTITLFLCLSFISAGWFSDLFGKATGKAVDSEVLGNPLYAYYALDGNAMDFSGHGFNGVVVGNVSWVANGLIGKSVYFNGQKNSYISILNGTNSAEMSYSLWVKPYDILSPTSSWLTLFIAFSNKNISMRVLQQKNSSGIVYAYDSFGIQMSGCSGFTQDQWQHLAVTVNPLTNQSFLYLNGVKCSQDLSFNRAGIPSGQNMRLGASSDGAYNFKGEIDEVKIYNKALTSSEVAQLYALRNQTISCYSDADCPVGETRFFCLNSSACASSISYSCENAGTNSSRCVQINSSVGCSSCGSFGCNSTSGRCNSNSNRVNGLCGTINNTCRNGTFFDIADNSTHYLWRCLGINAGTNASCSLAKPIHGVCGELNVCVSGDYADNEDNSTHYLWRCFGREGGNNTECSMPKPTCIDLINKVKNAQPYTDENGVFWDVYVGNWSSWDYINGNQENFIHYLSTFYGNPLEGAYANMEYNVRVFENKTIDLSSYSRMYAGDESKCGFESWRVGEEGSMEKFYYCVYSDDSVIAVPGRDYGHNQIALFWYNENVFVKLDFYSGGSLTEEEITLRATQKLNQFVNSLKDNEVSYDYVPEWSSLVDENRDQRIQENVESAFAFCSSEVNLGPGEMFVQGWCKTEPIICPEYGRQLKTCESRDVVTGESEKFTQELYCSPGICSGCFVPRWMGYDNGDNVCIPYGTRLGQIDSESEKILETEEVVSFMSSDRLILTFLNVSYTFYEGNTQEVEVYPGEQIIIRLDDIVYSDREGAENYAMITILDNFDAYCNYNGYVLAQKGDDSECQNSYECFSNECSSGFCVNTNLQVTQSAGLIVRILCKLSNLPLLGGTEEDYQQCLLEYS